MKSFQSLDFYLSFTIKVPLPTAGLSYLPRLLSATDSSFHRSPFFYSPVSVLLHRNGSLLRLTPIIRSDSSIITLRLLKNLDSVGLLRQRVPQIFSKALTAGFGPSPTLHSR
jgi:hypothetical protein